MFAHFVSHVAFPLWKKEMVDWREQGPLKSIEVVMIKQLLSGMIINTPFTSTARFPTTQRGIY